ncbi:6187_t:CDS:2, partial [Funneliformis caledonium]
MSIFTSRINIRRAIFTFSLNCTRSSSLQQIKPRIFTINSKAHSKITLTTKFNFIGSQNNTRKTIFYLPLIVGNRQFSRNSSSYNKHKEKESK